MNRIERVLFAMTDADRHVDDLCRAWVAPCGTSLEDTEAWQPDT